MNRTFFAVAAWPLAQWPENRDNALVVSNTLIDRGMVNGFVARACVSASYVFEATLKAVLILRRALTALRSSKLRLHAE